MAIEVNGKVAGCNPLGTGRDEIVVRASGLVKSYGSARVLNWVSLDVRKGELLGILGPNGSGKSTLLSILSGVERAEQGDVELLDKKLSAYSRKQLARRVAVLRQEALPPIGFRVREVVEMGRYPYQNWLGDEQGDAASQVERIMERLGLEPLADRPLDELSGGERQRVALAKAMAQNPQILLLDEPTTFLDIGYQMQIMNYVRSWQRETGLTVITVLHDLNLAAQYCDRIVVMRQGEIERTGPVESLMDAELIERVYGTRPVIVRHPDSGLPQILLRP